MGTNVFSSAGGQDLFVAKYDRAGNLLWARSAGSGGTDNWGLQVATDNAGNIYLPGNYNGTISFGTATLTAVGGQDCFLVKYDANGNFQWVRRGASSATDYGGGVAVDSTGAVLFTGYYDANVQFDGAPSVLTAGTADNMFLVKYDSNGNFLWQQSGTGSPYGQSVAVDSNNAAFVVGSMGNGGNFGGIQVASDNNGHANMFLAKFDSDGNAVWARSLASSGDALGRSLALDRQGNIFLGGTYLDNTTLGGFSLTCGGVADGYVLKCDSSGNVLWAQTVGGPGDDGVNSLAVDQFGNVLVGGTIDNGGTGGGFSFSPNGRNAFLLKLDASGRGLWSRLVTSSPVGTFYSVAYSGNGDLAAGGSFAGTATSGTFTMNNVGSQDGMVLVLTPAPTITVPLANQGILAGGNATLNAGMSGAGLWYQWYQNGMAVPNATNSTLVFNNAQPAQSGNYYVVATNYYGAVTSIVAGLGVEYSPNYGWFKTYGTAGAEAVNAMVYDASGNLYVAGYYYNTLTLGGYVLTSVGDRDLFLAKYDRAGNLLWARSAGGVGTDDWGIQIAVDSAGNVYLPGSTTDTISFGTVSLPHTGGRNCFVVKYNPAGIALWARREFSTSSGDEGVSVAVDSTDAVIFSGYYSADAQFDGAPAVLLSGSTGGNNLFVVKYDANGNFRWQQRGTPSPSSQGLFGQCVAVDTNNAVFVVGVMGDGGNIGGIQVSSGNSGHENTFLTKLDSTGTAVWAKSLTSSGDARGRNLALDHQGNIFVGGYFVNSTFGLTGAGPSDGFVMKCDTNGNGIWAQQVGGPGTDDISALAVDQFGNVLVGGDVDVGGTGGGFNFSPSGRNAYLIKFDGNGKGLWSRLVTSSPVGQFGTVALGLGGDIAAGGSFAGTGTAGPFTLNNQGGLDGMVLVLTPAPASITPLANQDIMAGGNAILNVVVSGAGLWYQWYQNGMAVPNATNSTLAFNNAQPAQSGNYYVVATNYYGSVTSLVGTLTVVIPPSITVQPLSLTNTLGSTANFGVTASGTMPFFYQWRFNGANLNGATSGTLTLSTIQGANAGNYDVVVTNAYGSITSTVATLTLLYPPNVTMPPQSQTNLAGTSVSFSVNVTGTAPIYYQWRFNGTNLSLATNSTLTFNSIQGANAGNYSVVVSNAYGSTTSAVAGLTVLLPPTLSIQPTNQVATVGGAARFSVMASGTLPLYYQWLHGGIPMPSATASQFTLASVQAADAGNYYCIVSNAYGMATSQVATLTLAYPPGITTQPQSQTKLFGATASFGVTVSGAAPLSFQWYKDFNMISGATSNSLQLTNVQRLDEGSYYVIVSNYLGSATSAMATLTIVDPASIKQDPQGFTALFGSVTSLMVRVSGSTPLYFQWYKDGAALLGANSATLPFGNLQSSQAGNFYVVVTNAYASVTSAVATVAVLSPPVFLSQPQSVSNAAGAGASFSVVADGTAPITCQWYKDGAILPWASSTNLSVPNVQKTDQGKYWIVLTNAYGSTTSAVATLYVSAGLVNGQFTNSAQIAINDNAPASPYPATINVSGMANQIQRVKVTLRKFTHTYMSDVRVLLVSPIGQKVLLMSAAGNGGANQVNLTFDDLAVSTVSGSPVSGTYKPTAATTGSLTTPAPAAPYATTLATLKGQDPNGDWLLYVLDSSAGDSGYIAEGWSLDIETITPPFITTHPQSQTVNTGGSATFAVGVTGAQPLFYQWRFNGSPLSGATNAPLTLANVQGAQAGNYTVVVTNASGSTTSLVATLTVLTTDPPYITSQPQSQTVVAGDTVSLSVTANGAQPLGYQWYKTVNSNQLTVISGATNFGLQIADCGISDAGNYQVVISNAYGVVTSAVATLTVIQTSAPLIFTQPQSQTNLVGGNASFTVQAGGTAPLAYQWFRLVNSNQLSVISGATNFIFQISNLKLGDAGYYRVVIANSFGSVTSAVAVLVVQTVINPPAITTQPQSRTNGVGTTASFTVSGTGLPTPTYQWYKSVNSNQLSVISGATNLQFTIFNLQSSDAGSYAVVLQNSGGSITSAVAVLTIADRPVILTQPQSQTNAPGDTATFQVTAVGQPVPTYQWYKGGAAILAATNSSYSIFNLLASDSGSYVVVAANFMGSVTSAVARLVIQVPDTLTIVTQP
ncbi:MAG: immunoglobulin domain-containing protein, partial [Verrucomicrobiota bacterium]